MIWPNRVRVKTILHREPLKTYYLIKRCEARQTAVNGFYHVAIFIILTNWNDIQACSEVIL